MTMKWTAASTKAIQSWGSHSLKLTSSRCQDARQISCDFVLPITTDRYELSGVDEINTGFISTLPNIMLLCYISRYENRII